MDPSPRTDPTAAAGFAPPRDAPRASEARYRALATASADVIYRMSADWREMRRLDGRGLLADTTEPTDRWLGEYILPDDQPRVTAAIEEAVRRKRVFELEHRVVRADATIGWTLSRAVPLFDDAGRIVEWIGTASDITGRKHAEEALRESEARYRKLFETMGQGYGECEMIRDAEGRAIDFRLIALNSAFKRLVGLEAKEAEGRTAREVIPGIEDWWVETFDDIVRRGEPHVFEHGVAPLGRWYQINAYPQGGDRFVALFEDVTDRKRSEEVLRESEARQKFLVRLGDTLRPIRDPVEIQREASKALREQLGAGRVTYWEFVEQNLVEGRVEDVEAGWPSFIGNRYRFDDFEPGGAELFGRGTTVWRDDVDAIPGITEAQRVAFAATFTRAYANATLKKAGRLVLCLVAYFNAPHVWSEQEIKLVEEVAERTWAAVARAIAEAALRDSEERAREARDRDALRRLLAQAEEEERRRLARELHDEAGQHLTALGLGLQALSDVAQPGSEIDRRASELRALANTLAVEMHAIALRLRPKALDDFGLEAALAAYVEEWSRHSGIEVDVHATVGAARLPTAVETTVYRVVQEALTNVARHSGATHTGIVVERRDGHVIAVVEDDGCGFTVPDISGDRRQDSGGLGLLGIGERVALLGGTLDVESATGGGTTLFVRIPLAGLDMGTTGDAPAPLH